MIFSLNRAAGRDSLGLFRASGSYITKLSNLNDYLIHFLKVLN